MGSWWLTGHIRREKTGSDVISKTKITGHVSMSGKQNVAFGILNTVYLFLQESFTMLTLSLFSCVWLRASGERSFWHLAWFCPLTTGFWVIQWHFHEFSGMFSFSFRSGFFHFIRSWGPPRFLVCLFLMWLKKTTLLMLTGGAISAWYLSLTHTHSHTHAPKHLIALLSWPNFCGVSDGN